MRVHLLIVHDNIFGRTSKIKVARRADITFIRQSVIFHVNRKMLGLTEALSTDSAMVWLAVHVGDEVHS